MPAVSRKLSLELAVARGTEEQLASAFAFLADRHDREADIRDQGTLMASWSQQHIAKLKAFEEKYGRAASERPERLRSALFAGTRIGGLGLLMDLKDAALLVDEQELTYTALTEAASEVRDKELVDTIKELDAETTRQLTWLKTRYKQTAGQALTVDAAPGAEVRGSMPKHLTATALPDPVWAPVAVAVLTLVIGVPALLFGMQPWLLPSLGPTAFLQVMFPALPASRLYNVVVGHAGGLVSGFIGVAVFNAWNDPAVLSDHTLTVGRLGAATVAMALSILVGILLRASHPPAAATVLLVALGSIKDLQQIIAFAIGLIILAVAGEVVRRLRLGEWSWGRAKVAQRESASG
jgi:hypothetical protein